MRLRNPAKKKPNVAQNEAADEQLLSMARFVRALFGKVANELWRGG